MGELIYGVSIIVLAVLIAEQQRNIKDLKRYIKVHNRELMNQNKIIVKIVKEIGGE